MPALPRIFFAALAAVFIFQSSHAGENSSPLTLLYTNAAEKWTEALPVGNGRLGAMIFGGVDREHLQLNEDTLWAGGPYDPDNTNALAALPEVRQLIFEGQYDDAASLVVSNLMAKPVRQMPYETVGEMLLQSQVGVIELLPALPKAWPTGTVKGLRARGNFTVDIEWKNGKLFSATIHSPAKNSCKVRYGDKVLDLKIKAGGTVRLNENLE